MTTAKLLAALAQARGEAGAPLETYDPTYLEALIREGIDLPAFLHGWCAAMHGDLVELQARQSAPDAPSRGASLHRLAGGVGLVGARNLADALHRASTVEFEAHLAGYALDTLMTRTRQFMIHLEAVGRAMTHLDP
ncbi:MAG TPA: hypothetical protein VFE79_09360 [Paraburkholderia sp.]|nr:hypothetical protein [Paraburkholderia sp.]